jgi:hypothetical protein
VSSIKYQCGWINIWRDRMHFNEFWIANLLIYEHIWYENYDFMSQKWEKINQKFVLLKVASDKKFGQHFRNGANVVCLKKPNTNSFISSRAHIDMFINGQVEKIRVGRHRATWTSLLTNEKAKSTFSRWLLHPNRPPTWALHMTCNRWHISCSYC